MAILAGGGFCLFLVLAALFRFYAFGKAAEKHKQQERALEDIRKAARLRERLRHDPDFAARLRRRFLRR